MREEFSVIEEALLNSIPARQTVLLDGWVLRLNQNYTYRANCACPLRYVPGGDAVEKIRICEELFHQNRLPAVFKVTPALQEDLPQILLTRNYENIKTVHVMRSQLNGEAAVTPPGIECSETPDPDWLASSARLTGVMAPDLVAVHCEGLRKLAVGSIFVKAVADGKIIGCGYGTVEREHVGIYDLHVEPEYRRRGIGTAICNAAIRYGREHGAKFAYLIVHSKNQNAITLYSHMGFTKLYEYNFYEKADGAYRIIDA